MTLNGTNQIEDYTYYIENEIMSDELSEALKKYNELAEKNFEQWNNLNDQKIEISNINYENGCFLITTKEPKYTINISLKKDIDIKSLEINIKENIAKYVYLDQHFITEKYSYVIAIKDNIYITKKSDNIV